jgi:hypothetical protein
MAKSSLKIGLMRFLLAKSRVVVCWEFIPHEVQYASLYWVQHLQSSGSETYNSDEASRFLKEHLLHWLEALGWMGKISEGIKAILSLEVHGSVSCLFIT